MKAASILTSPVAREIVKIGEAAEARKPAVTLADTDPDVVAAKAAETTDASAPGAGEADASANAQVTEEAAAEPTPAGEGDSPKECSSCGHLLSYHRNENGAPSACWQPDCECQAFTPADDPAAEVTEFADEGPCARRGCGHALCYHNGFTGCQINRCHCKGFVQPDPLGVDGYDPKAEKQGEADATT